MEHQRALDSAAPQEVFEFFHPFALVEGVAELVRVLNPEYGAMDMAVVVPPQPRDIYVNSDAGERFLRDRFPNVRRHRLSPTSFRLATLDEGQAVRAKLRAAGGPVRRLDLTIRPIAGAPWETERYRGDEVWGSPLGCRGVDLRVRARAKGTVQLEEKPARRIDQEAIVYLGSFGRLVPQSDAA